MENPFEDISDLEEDPEKEKDKDKEKNKGKEKMGEKKKKAKMGENMKAPEEEMTQWNKFKRKAHKAPLVEEKLSVDDIDSIASHVYDTLEDSMTAIVSLQNAMNTALDVRIAEMKILLERTPEMSKTPATPSTSRTPWGDSISKWRMWFVHILLTSVRLPSGSPIDQTGFIKVNLVDIPIETLQLVQMQVHEELREREYNTYQKKK